MKKIFMILLAGVFIAGCSNDDTTNGGEKDSEQVTDNNDDEEKKDTYQIGETAQITNSSYGFPYEITVHDFRITKDEIEGYAYGDFFMGSFEMEESNNFAVVNVTIKNTGEDTIVPDSSITSFLDGDLISENNVDEIFTERKEELEPGEEITGDLVFLTRYIYEDDDVLNLTYEAADTKEEVRFELPVPEKKS